MKKNNIDIVSKILEQNKDNNMYRLIQEFICRDYIKGNKDLKDLADKKIIEEIFLEEL